MVEVVVDTNVAVVANGLAEQANDGCVERCGDELERIIDGCVVVLDSDGLILDEYQKILNFSGQPGVGDFFFKWLFFNQANPDHCRKVAITPHADRGFEEFPDDSALTNFDRDDRKFIAVALASQTTPPILNASDTDWWNHLNALKQHGIEVSFLCPELMERDTL